MSKHENLKGIGFVDIEHLKNAPGLSELPLDFTIPLPVLQIDLDQAINQQDIIAGLTKVVAFDEKNQHHSYYLQLLTQLSPDLIRTLWQAAKVKVEKKQWDLAQQWFELVQALVQYWPESPKWRQQNTQKALLNLALLWDKKSEEYAQQEQSHEEVKLFAQKAKEYYQQALEQHPLDLTYYYYGHFLLKMGQVKQARELLEKYIDMTENLVEKKNTQQLLETIEKQLHLDELFQQAYDFMVLQQEEKALETIEKFLQIQTQIWTAWFVKGWALRRKQDYPQALQAFEQAYQLQTNNSDLLNEMSICCLETQKYEQAKQYLEKAISLEPEQTKLLSNLAYVYYLEENTQKAHELWAQVLAIDPKDPLALAYQKEHHTP